MCVKLLQEQHSKAWEVVSTYLDENLRVFNSKAEQAESVVMPAVTSWLQESLQSIPEVRETDDHAIVAWLCMPTTGICSALKYDFYITFISNFLAQYRRNGLVMLVFPNRAAQATKDSAEKRLGVL